MLKVRAQHVNEHAYANQQTEYAGGKNKRYRLGRERGNPVGCQGEHFLQGVFRLSCGARTNHVFYRSRRITYHRYQSTQVEVSLFKVRQLLQRSSAHQSEVGMVIHGFHAHSLLKLIEHQCGVLLEERVALARYLHAVNYVVPLVILVYHSFHGAEVVLQVHIYGYYCVTMILGGHHSCHYSVLVPYVLGKVNPSEVMVRIVQLLYQLPCIVAAAVVYQQHKAVGRYLLFRHQSV